jgi:hypothetical protein
MCSKYFIACHISHGTSPAPAASTHQLVLQTRRRPLLRALGRLLGAQALASQCRVDASTVPRCMHHTNSFAMLAMGIATSCHNPATLAIKSRICWFALGAQAGFVRADCQEERKRLALRVEDDEVARPRPRGDANTAATATRLERCEKTGVLRATGSPGLQTCTRAKRDTVSAAVIWPKTTRKKHPKKPRKKNKACHMPQTPHLGSCAAMHGDAMHIPVGDCLHSRLRAGYAARTREVHCLLATAARWSRAPAGAPTGAGSGCGPSRGAAAAGLRAVSSL